MLVVEPEGSRENCDTQSAPAKKISNLRLCARITTDITSSALHLTDCSRKLYFSFMTYLKYLVGTNGIFVTTAGRFFPRT